jgi:uncharacterized Ntn-hydrolase superfamily protein
MKSVLAALTIAFFALPVTAQDQVYEEELATFSIVARDPATGQLGECMTSKALAGGNRAVTALGGVAVIAHQQSANPMYGRLGMELIKMGMTPQDALDFLLRADTAKESRQVAMIDIQGRTAAWTNGGASAGQPGAWRGHKCGTDYCAQGNSLTGPEVVAAVARTFESAKGTLAERMLAAIDAGQEAGGDARGKQTALIVVVRPLSGNNPTSDRVIDFRVDDHPEPLVELRRLVKLNESGAVISQGNTKLQQGDAKGAIALFIQARDLAPTSDNAWIALANGYLRNNQKTEAFSALRKAVELNPNNKTRLPTNQNFESIRQDPEFLKIVGG